MPIIGVNVLPNSSFEVNLSGWGAQSGAVATWSNEQAKDGLHSAKVVTGTTAWAGLRMSGYESVYMGDTWRVGAWIYRTESSVQIALLVYDRREVCRKTLTFPTTAGWVYVEGTITITSDTMQGLQIRIQKNTSASNITYYVDAVGMFLVTMSPLRANRQGR